MRTKVLLLLLLSFTSAQWNQYNQPQQQSQQQLQLQQQSQQQALYRNGQNPQQYSGYSGSFNNQANSAFNRFGSQQIGNSQLTATLPVLPNANSASKLGEALINGAAVQIQVTGYSNPSLLLSNATTCSCTSSCPYLESNQQNACKFAFVTIISSVDMSVQYYTTEFFPFGGSLDTRTPGNWSQSMSFQMTSKPVAVDVFVYHLGVVMEAIPSSTGVQNLLFFNKLTLVDSFVVDVYSYNASEGQVKTETLQGKMLNTNLMVTWSVKCINGMLGSHCNLVCGVLPPDQNGGGTYSGSSTTSTTLAPNVANTRGNNAYNPNLTLCKSSLGMYVQCEYNAARTQVSRCMNCVNGVTPNGTCIGFNGDIVDQGDLVSAGFRTWTIVLGSLLGLTIIIIIGLILIIFIVRNRHNEEMMYKRNHEKNGGSSVASRPLLDDEWSAAPPRRNLVPPPPPHADISQHSNESFRNGTITQSPNQRQEHQV